MAFKWVKLMFYSILERHSYWQYAERRALPAVSDQVMGAMQRPRASGSSFLSYITYQAEYLRLRPCKIKFVARTWLVKLQSLRTCSMQILLLYAGYCCCYSYSVDYYGFMNSQCIHNWIMPFIVYSLYGMKYCIIRMPWQSPPWQAASKPAVNS